jgi:DNA (cytosine-5)-methyltransferase 1
VVTAQGVPLLRVAELCAGYGGLFMSLQLAGWPVELVWYAENDPDASAVLAAHHPGLPNLGDITAVDWSAAGPVDVLAAGYPCTDLSNAGKRAGIEGENSGIWRNVADAVRDLRPRLVLLENVSAHLARGFGRVLGDLAGLGYDAQWTCLRASDVGAPPPT